MFSQGTGTTAMNRKRLPISMLVVLPVGIGLSLYAFTSKSPLAEEPPAPAVGVDLQTSVSPPPSPPQLQAEGSVPSTEATPFVVVTQRGDLREGVLVRVATGDSDCLNARQGPSTAEPNAFVNMCLPNGFEAMISSSPVEAEGRWWWHLAGGGYVAEEYIEYAGEMGGRVVAQSAGQPGLIAFLRDPGEVWVMRPDGSDQRQLRDESDAEDPYGPWLSDLRWSPDGTKLSYNMRVYREGASAQTNDFYVIALDGSDLVHLAGVAGGGWSPDGRSIGVVADVEADGMGGGWRGVPGVLDLETGAVAPVGVDLPWDLAWQQDAPQFNFDGTLLLLTYSYYDEAAAVTHRGTLITEMVGSQVRQFSPSEDTWHGAPTWSPVGNQVAYYVSKGNESGYEVVDAVGGTTLAYVPLPAPSEFRGGRCGGGSDMYRPAFSRDGATLHFPSMLGAGGTTGIWSFDLRSKQLRQTQSASPQRPASGPGDLVAFDDGGALFTANAAGGFGTLIAGGRSPVWSPDQ
jgi:Tol biopolymer transport system component